MNAVNEPTIGEVVARAPDLPGQIAAVRREIALRRNVYPNLVKAGRMKQEEADRRIAEMQAVEATLVAIKCAQLSLDELQRVLGGGE